MEMRAGFEPANNSFAGCPLEPLEYRIMVMPAGLEPAISGLRGWRPNQLDEGTLLETHAGLEPVIATVKGLCPYHLDEWAMLQGRSLQIMQRRYPSREYHQCEHATALRGRLDYRQSEAPLHFAICISPEGN